MFFFAALASALLSPPADAADSSLPADPLAHLQFKEPDYGYDVMLMADRLDGPAAVTYLMKRPHPDLAYVAGTGLARLWSSRFRHEDAISLWRWLLRERPDGAEAGDFQRQIAAAEVALGNQEEAWSATRRYLQNYGPGTSWHKLYRSDPKKSAAESDALESEIRKTAEALTKMGRENKDEDLMFAGAAAYEEYLRAWPTNPKVYDIRFTYADLLYELERYDDAYDQFMKVVEMGPLDRHAKPASEGALDSARKMASELRVKTGPAATSTSPQEANRWERRFAQTATLYMDLHPDAEGLDGLRLEVANNFFRIHQWADAAGWFQAIVDRDPTVPEANEAIRKWIASEDQRKRYADEQALIERLLADSRLTDAALRKALETVLPEAAWKAVMAEVGRGASHRWSAAALLEYRERFPAGAHAAEAGDEAVRHLEASGKLKAAKKIRKDLERTQPAG